MPTVRIVPLDGAVSPQAFPDATLAVADFIPCRRLMDGRWLIVALAVYYPLVLFGGAALKAEFSHVSQ